MCPSSFQILPTMTPPLPDSGEILEQVEGPIDGFCSGVGTGGTISGIGEVLKAQNPQIEIWAVEPENAAILAGGNIGTHLQMGIGDGVIPTNLNRAFTLISALSLMRRPSGPPRIWPGKKASCAGFPAAPMWRRPFSWPGSWGRERPW